MHRRRWSTRGRLAREHARPPMLHVQRQRCYRPPCRRAARTGHSGARRPRAANKGLCQRQMTRVTYGRGPVVAWISTSPSVLWTLTRPHRDRLCGHTGIARRYARAASGGTCMVLQDIPNPSPVIMTMNFYMITYSWFKLGYPIPGRTEQRFCHGTYSPGLWPP